MKDGKLFGKINIIDLLVILLIVAAAIFLGMRLGNRSSGTPSAPTTSRVRFVVRVTRMDLESYEAVKARYDAGETQLIAGEDLIDGYIVDLRSTTYSNPIATDDGRYVLAEDPNYITVYYTLEAAVSNPITNMVVTQEVRIGAPFWVKTVGTQFSGTIIDLETIG